MAKLKDLFCGWKAVNITTPAIRTYIERRQRMKAANGTINRELAALKRMFSLAVQAEKLRRRPHIPSLSEDNIRAGFFGETDFLAPYEALPKHLQPVVMFAYTYGWRIHGEVLRLTWDRVDLVAGSVRMDPGVTKNRQGRVIFLTPGLRCILEAQWEQARIIVLGESPQATAREVAEAIPWVSHRVGRPIKDFRRAWTSACQRVKLNGRIPHDFRRTAIRNMVWAGIPERVAMMISDHRTRSVFDRYDIVSEGDLRAATEKLEPAGLLTLKHGPER